MKSQNTIELVGIGNIKIYPIKAEQKEFEVVNKDLKPLKVKPTAEGKRKPRTYLDSEGKEYTEAEVGRNIGGKFVQKVKRTEKVSKMEIVDKTTIIGNFMSDGYFIVDGDETATINLDKQIGEDKALKFKYKSSSNGLKWRQAYLYRFQNAYCMDIGLGTKEEGLKSFNVQKEAVKQLEDLKEIVVTNTAEELENAIEI